MKKIFILFMFLTIGQSSFAHFDMSVPVEGNSIATNDLQFETVRHLYKKLSLKYPSCTDFSIKNTQIIHLPYDTKMKNGNYVKGYWKELWSVNYCTEVIQIPITYTIKKNKTKFHIDEISIIKNK